MYVLNKFREVVEMFLPLPRDQGLRDTQTFQVLSLSDSSPSRPKGGTGGTRRGVRSSVKDNLNKER